MSPAFRRYATDDLVAARPDAAARARARIPLIVVLDDIRSAHNVGLLFRLCDCVNIESLWLAGITAFPGVSERATNRMSKTGVGGSLEVLPWLHVEDPIEAVRERQQAGWRVVVVEQGEGTVSWRQADYGEKTLLIFGHERKGVRDELIALADTIVELPVRGITNSLNIATCASVLLYEVLGRALDRGLNPHPEGDTAAGSSEGASALDPATGDGT